MKYKKEKSVSNSNNEPKLSLKFTIGVFLAYFHYFIISISIGLILTFIINRYSKEKFIIKSQLLIKEKGGYGNLDGIETFLTSMQLVNTKMNIDNEIGILKSRLITQETLKNTDFNISYFSSGKIVSSELYRNSPFVIVIDSNHLQTYDIEYYVKFKNYNEFELEVVKSNRNKELVQFVPKTLKSISIPFTYPKKSFKNNDIIESPYFKFKFTITNPEAIKENLEFKFILNSPKSLVKKYTSSFQVIPINKRASIVEISKLSSEPEKDVNFINTLMKTYIQKGLSDKNEISVNTINFIDNYLITVSDSLGVFEDRLQNFRLNNKLIDLKSQGQNLLKNLFELENKKSEEEIKQKYYDYLTTYIKKGKDLEKVIAPSIMGISDPLLAQLITKLSEVYSEKIILEQSTQKQNPMLIEKEMAIKSLKASILENLETIKGGSSVIVKEFNNQIFDFEKIASTLPEKEQILLNIERKYKLNDKLLTYLLEKRTEAGIAGASNVSDKKIVDFAIVESKVSPKIILNYLVGLLISLIIPSIIIIITELLNDKIYNHSILERETDIPVFGNIPKSTEKSSLVISNHPKSIVSESFRNLRSNINYLGINKDKNNTILITSTVSGEGKTFVSINLASVLAIAGYKTLLIGLDLRKPKIFQDFKLNNSIGITNYIIGNANKKQIIQQTNIENLSIITAGPIPPNPAELIMSNNFKNLLTELKSEYDFIILDTPPVGMVAEGIDLIQYSDVILYIVRQNISKKNYLNLINDLYAKEKETKIGLVFNDINFSNAFGYRDDRYGYGYGSATNGYGYSIYGKGAYEDSDNVKKTIWQRIFG
jgi:tyrosine-protein kinase Etk/Wzc